MSSGKGKGKRFDEAEQEAMLSDLAGSAFFQQPTSTQVDKTTKPQVDKYTTHLKPETIKAVKRYAFEHEMKDYEVVQQALDHFLQEKSIGTDTLQ